MVDLPSPDPAPRLRLGQGLLSLLAFLAAACLAIVIAWGSAVVVESRSAKAVNAVLLGEGIAWAQVEADGLQVKLSGTAPTEAARFRALNLAGTVVDSGRLIDGFDVTPAKSVEAPRFSVEMLRNDDGIQLIGLLPKGEGLQRLADAAEALTPGAKAADMLETADYPAPDGWDAALAYGLQALELLPRSKISVAADGVVITAIAASVEEKHSLEAQLATAAPKGLPVKIDISAPRPVLSPFTLRFVKDAQGARFDACAADTEKARDQITAAARAAGVQGKIVCIVGLGVPSPSWAAATAAAIASVARLGDGTVTFSDADVTLRAGDTVTQAAFDREIGDLRNALPDVFSLNASLAKKQDAANAGPAEFTASLAADTGRIELRGRLSNDRVQAAVDSFAKSRFGVGKVYLATRIDTDLPDGWPERVLAGLAALAELHDGKLLVRPDTVEVSGVTGSQLARARVSQILSTELGQGQTFKVDVTYDEALDPLAALPTPQECAERVNAVLASQKIRFAPGSAEIDAASGAVMDALTKALTDCNGIQMEIGGHTDAQGSDSGNKALSQARAEAVMVALQGRQVDVSAMRAVGYGETMPIADNTTDAGREANRRIEFTLIGQPAAPQPGANGTLPAAGAGAEPSYAPATMSKKPRPRPNSH